MSTRVDAGGLEIKNVLVGIYRYQFQRMEDLCVLEKTSRAAIIREAIDLWLRAYALKENKEAMPDE